jgi:hypothetical protein
MLFGIMMKLGQEPSNLPFVSEFIPSSPEKAGVLLLEEV